MPRTTPDAGVDRTDPCQEITDKIVRELESGRALGRALGDHAPLDMPHSAMTRSCYSGINIVIPWDAVISRVFSTPGEPHSGAPD
jgi:antirestriction protein ArdC